jgi:osmotically-inducible protein OsmY
MKAIGMLLVAGLFAAGGGATARAAEPADDSSATPAEQDTDAQPGSTAPRVANDAPELRQRIETALEREPTLKNQRIGVSLRQCHVDDGPTRCDVTLTGTVATQSERATAERVARIKGVVLIDNRLELADASEGGNAR